MLTFTPVSVVSNIILSLSIVTKVQVILSLEPTTREDFLQCEFDTNTFYTVYFIPNHKSSFSSNHMVLWPFRSWPKTRPDTLFCVHLSGTFGT